MQNKVQSPIRLALNARVVSACLIALGVVAIGVPAMIFRQHWLPEANAILATMTGSSHDHELHDDAAHAHGSSLGEPDAHVHDEEGVHNEAESAHANMLELSPQAWKNAGLKTAPVQLQSFVRTTTVPAMVVGRSGRSEVEVTAPLGGRVTKIYAVEGEAVTPGQPLFDLRLTHEELVQAQSEFLRMTEELDVVAAEIQRIKSVNVPGAIPGKTIREREYEQQKLQAVFNARRQSLLLHGLTEAQVQSILNTRTLVRDVTVITPNHPVDGHAKPPTHPFTVAKLSIVLGQYVNAGDALCRLFDYCDLYIQGRAFEQDAGDLMRAAKDGATVTALRETEGGTQDSIARLKIVFVENEIDAQSRALYFYVNLPNKTVQEYTAPSGHRFWTWLYKPGQRMQLRVPVEQWHDRIVLPVDGVAQDGLETYIFRQHDDDFERVPVHVEYRDQLFVVIENDGSVHPGDVVAISGAHQLQMALKNMSGGAVDPHAGHNHG